MCIRDRPPPTPSVPVQRGDAELRELRHFARTSGVCRELLGCTGNAGELAGFCRDMQRVPGRDREWQGTALQDAVSP
eukprot:3408139-Alexandrium_andersonii.AAC.1